MFDYLVKHGCPDLNPTIDQRRFLQAYSQEAALATFGKEGSATERMWLSKCWGLRRQLRLGERTRMLVLYKLFFSVPVKSCWVASNPWALQLVQGEPWKRAQVIRGDYLSRTVRNGVKMDGKWESTRVHRQEPERRPLRLGELTPTHKQ